MNRKIKLIWYLLRARMGTINIGRNEFLGGAYFRFSFYGWKAFRLRYRIFLNQWKNKEKRYG